MKRHFKVVRALMVIALVLIGPGALLAGNNSSTRPVSMGFFTPTADQQTGIGCPNQPNVMTPGFLGDGSLDLNGGAVGPTTAWNMSPWPQTLITNPPLSSSQYVDGNECSYSGSCLSVQFSKNLSALSINTNSSLDPTTKLPRAMAINWVPCATCSYGPGPAAPFGSTSTTTPGLLTIFAPTPFPNMAVCSSTACPESESVFARFWFNDPAGNTNLQYRLDWSYLRVLRVSTSTWYAVADSCDGSQIATLYRLANNHKSQTISRQGSYLMPFFISASQ